MKSEAIDTFALKGMDMSIKCETTTESIPMTRKQIESKIVGQLPDPSDAAALIHEIYESRPTRPVNSLRFVKGDKTIKRIRVVPTIKKKAIRRCCPARKKIAIARDEDSDDSVLISDSERDSECDNSDSELSDHDANSDSSSTSSDEDPRDKEEDLDCMDDLDDDDDEDDDE